MLNDSLPLDCVMHAIRLFQNGRRHVLSRDRGVTTKVASKSLLM